MSALSDEIRLDASGDTGTSATNSDSDHVDSENEEWETLESEAGGEDPPQSAAPGCDVPATDSAGEADDSCSSLASQGCPPAPDAAAAAPHVASPDPPAVAEAGGQEPVGTDERDDGDADCVGPQGPEEYPLVEPHSRISVTAKVDDKTGKILVEITHRDGKTADEVWHSRSTSLRNLLPLLRRVPGAEGAYQCAVRKLEYDGPHESFASDRGYISGRLVTELEVLVRAEQTVSAKLRALTAAYFDQGWEEEKAQIEAEVIPEAKEDYRQRRMQMMMQRLASGDLEVKNLPPGMKNPFRKPQN